MTPTQKGLKSIVRICKHEIIFAYLHTLLDKPLGSAIRVFTITSPPITMLELGLSGVMFVRSLTIFLVKKGKLNDLVYLDHGAHWAILILSILLLLSAQVEIPEVVIGLIGAIVICASLISSLIYNKKHKQKAIFGFFCLK